MTLLRILIVEDDAIIALLLAETVEGLGHNVCAIADTEFEAVAKAASCQPDLMIVDAGLIEGDGVSAMNTILKTRFVRHLFVTANARQVHQLRPDAVILQKPFFVPELIHAIERALAVSAPGRSC